MFVDASAIVALVERESDADNIADRLQKSSSPVTSAIAYFKAVLAVARKHPTTVAEAKGYVDELLRITGITMIEISPREADGALQAFEKFGKGRHRAGLNMGDCFAYACAKNRGVPLLCKGADFSLTDIELA